jgi:tetratricopeptide (TPR) repeat protein
LLGAYWGNWYPGYWNGYSGYPAYYGYDYAQPDYYAMNQPSGGVEGSQSTTAAAGDNQYLDEAITNFQNGNYREAQRLAGHAIVDDPQNAEAHALICLSAFATGNYQAAAAEAHAVASIRGVPGWGHIYGLYNDVDRFTSQFRPLEKFVREHPKDASGQFLVGFLYMAMGHRAEAQEHLAQVVDQMPKDRVAQNLLGDAGGQVPTTATRPSGPESFEGSGANPVNPNQPSAPNPPTEDRGTSSGHTPSGPPTGEPLPAPARPRAY